MANYRKSFNFRTGLQVDNDNFVVNANGLVGIGTSIPENYLLNVYGDTRVTGVVTTGSLNAGVGTVTTLTATNSSLGVATVTSIQIAGGPVITDLVGYAYTVFTTDAGGGISTTSRIGIGTISDTTDQLKVFGDTNLSGDLNVSNSTISMSGGIVTATTFVGNVTGTATTANNLSDGANITTGTIDAARLPDLITSNINISSGISTFNDVRVGSAVTIGSSGIVTATTFVGNVTGTATTANNLSDGANITTGTIDAARLSGTYNINVNASSGISTFVDIKVGSAVTVDSSGINTPSGIITASSFVGDVTGTATTATNLADGANITTGTISDDRLPDLITSNINISSGISTFNDIKVGSAVTIGSSGIVTATTFVGNVTGTATTATALSGTPDITVGQVTSSNLSASGIVTATTELNVGSDGVGLTALSTGNLGIGTTNPTSELLIRKSSGSLLEVISDSGQSRISVGQSVGVGKSTGVIRFGNSAHDLDIINNDNDGNINFLLNGNGSAGTGKFSWQNGNGFTEAMSLNANGNFSVSGVTTLASDGGTTTTGGSLYVNGTVTATNFIGNVSLQSIIASNVNVNTGVSTVTHLDIVANANPLVSAKLTLDPNATVGLGTSQPIVDFDARDKTALFGSVGINTTDNSFTPSLYVAGNVAIEDSIGIGTTASITGGPGLEIHTGFVDLYDTRVSIESINTNVTVVIDDKTNVGIGSTQPKAAVDLSLAGKGGSGGQYAYLILPKVTNSERSGFASTESGAIIFNTDTSTFQGYTGIGWTDLH